MGRLEDFLDVGEVTARELEGLGRTAGADEAHEIWKRYPWVGSAQVGKLYKRFLDYIDRLLIHLVDIPQFGEKTEIGRGHKLVAKQAYNQSRYVGPSVAYVLFGPGHDGLACE